MFFAQKSCKNNNFSLIQSRIVFTIKTFQYFIYLPSDIMDKKSGLIIVLTNTDEQNKCILVSVEIRFTSTNIG